MPGKTDQDESAEEVARRTPSAVAAVTSFVGLVTNSDPHDLPAGASPDSVNAYPSRPGELGVRPGACWLRFPPRRPVVPPPPPPHQTTRSVSARSLARASSRAGRFSVVHATASATAAAGSSGRNFFTLVDNVDPEEMGTNVLSYGVRTYDPATTGPVDSYAAMQALLDSLTTTNTSGADLYFPAGNYYFSKMLVVSKPNVRLRGAGSSLTFINQLPYDFPWVVFDPALSQPILAGNRPDSYGALDSSLAPSPGAWKGFASSTNSAAATCPFGVPSYGIRDGNITNGRGLDHYGTVADWTIELAVDIPGLWSSQTSQYNIVGVGGYDNPLFVLSLDPPGPNLTMNFRTNDLSVEPGTPYHLIRAAVPAGTSGFQRVRFWVKTSTNSWGCTVGATNCTTTTGTVAGTFPATLVGKKLNRNRGNYVFNLGPSSNGASLTTGWKTKPNVKIHAYRVSNTARLTDGVNDQARYGVDANTIVAHDGTRDYGPQTLAWATSVSLTGSNGGSLVIVPATADFGGLQFCSVSGFTIVRGAPSICYGSTLGFRVHDVIAKDGSNGLAALRTNVCYTLSVTDSSFSGWECAVDMFETIATMRNINFVYGGYVMGRFTGCSLYLDVWQSQFMNSAGGVTVEECILDFPVEEYAGLIDIRNGSVDNEGAAYVSDSIIRISPVRPEVGSTTVAITNVSAEYLGPGAYMVNLVGPSSSTNPNVAVLTNVRTNDTSGAGALSAAGCWKGTVDTRACKSPARSLATPGPVHGGGASNFVVY